RAIPVSAELLSGSEEAPERTSPIRNWIPFMPVAFLVLALGATFYHDLKAKAPEPEVVKGNPLPEGPTREPRELLEVQFHDKVIPVTIGIGGAKSDVTKEVRDEADWLPSMRFCPHVLNERRERVKRL